MRKGVCEALGQVLSREVFDLRGLDLISEFEPKNARVEVKLTVERALDVLCLAKTVLLTGEGYIGAR